MAHVSPFLYGHGCGKSCAEKEDSNTSLLFSLILSNSAKSSMDHSVSHFIQGISHFSR